ncbi:MAG: DUF2249 domain-containing protein [Alphaproteobacteria bacterium]|nr:DUF2249 domain-containing protein [Alphaproteobacteria bacterium]
MPETTKHKPVAGDVPVLWEAGAPCLDLRDIHTPPKPLVAILELIERAECGDTVRVLMARDPVNLYPELVERGWSWTKEPAAGDDGGLRLTLTRTQPLPESSESGS